MTNKMIFRLEDLPALSEECFNIIPQVNAGKKLIDAENGQAILFLRGLDGYTPMQLSHKFGEIYTLEPMVAIHGVGNEVTDDSYTDLKGILIDGFQTQLGIRNAFVQKEGSLDLSGAESWAYTSDNPETFRDSYALEMKKIQIDADLREPILVTEKDPVINVSSAKSQDLSPIIFLDPQLTPCEARKRISFYQEHLPTNNFRTIHINAKKYSGVA